MRKFLSILLLGVVLSTTSFQSKKEDEKASLTIDVKKLTGNISPNVMGFNIVYCYEGDAAWQSGSGKVPKLLKGIGAGQLRYPGGTVVTKYHWETPTGQGWKDSWDTDFSAAKNTAPETFMNIDEYLQLTKVQKMEPLVGINMGSGMKHGKVQEGINEAVRLVKHCLKGGYKVKYYYLDNEPYQHDANYTFKPEEYAKMINLYVPAMKKVDPGIKIIVNTHPRSDNYIKPLLEIAGKNIDLVDVHMYWKFKNASFENWKKEAAITHQSRGKYSEQRAIWENIFAESGYPNIKLCVLEWNIGPPGETTPPTEAQAALMVSEQFSQFLQSGLFMSCFWPVSWPDKTDWTSRALFQARENYRPNEMYKMFTYFKDALGNDKVESLSTNERLINLATRSKDGKILSVYLVNKYQDSENLAVSVNLNGFKASGYHKEGFDDKGVAFSERITKTSSSHSVSIPKNSFVKLTFR